MDETLKAALYDWRDTYRSFQRSVAIERTQVERWARQLCMIEECLIRLVDDMRIAEQVDRVDAILEEGKEE